VWVNERKSICQANTGQQHQLCSAAMQMQQQKLPDWHFAPWANDFTPVLTFWQCQWQRQPQNICAN